VRIAQIAPLVQSIPPRGYGGTERVISLLTEELVRRGHDVTLFASGDSTTNARLEPMSERAFWQAAPSTNVEFLRLQSLAMYRDVYRRAEDFDIIHSHTGHHTFSFADLSGSPTVVTMHGLLDIDYVRYAFRRMPEVPVVSLSLAQRRPLDDLAPRWVGCVPNGIAVPSNEFIQTGGYLAFLGRIAPYKGPHLAIEVARAVGMPLKIGAAIHPVEMEFWETAVKPLVDQYDNVEFLGEVDDQQKAALLGGAAATLFPSDWPEPFGLVVAESLACGTPVIALDRGAIREIFEDGVHGFICANVTEMVEAVRRVAQIDREECRRRGALFTPAKMAERYEDVYARVTGGGSGALS
jgi:glycosyltransferase involved in cell wall biosynthesis